MSAFENASRNHSMYHNSTEDLFLNGNDGPILLRPTFGNVNSGLKRGVASSEKLRHNKKPIPLIISVRTNKILSSY